MAVTVPRRRLSRRSLRDSLIVFIGVVLANVGNYVFQLIAGRYLGPTPYSDLAALLTVINLIALPLGGVQIWVARNVAEYRARDAIEVSHWFVRHTLLYATLTGAVGTLILLAGVKPLQSAISINSRAAMIVTVLTVLPAFVTPVAWGLAQGLERFGLVAAMVASAPLVRIVVGLGALALGYGVAGAMAGTLFANVITIVVPLWIVRSWLARANVSDQTLTRTDAMRSLLPVVLGLLALTALTSIDVLVAKRWFDSHLAGIYGSASLIGRLILYLPTAIVTVLLPRVAARTAADMSSLDILGWSLGVTAAASIVATAIYAAVPNLIINLTFGAAYDPATKLLWPFGLAMTCFALVNVLLIYHLGRREYRIVWLLLAASVIQLAIFASVRTTPRGLIWIDTAIAFALVVAHEVITRGLGLRALRSVIEPRT